MHRVRPADLGVSFEPNGTLLVRAPTRGLGARVPPMAIGVLAFCSEPRTEEEVLRVMGPPGVQLFRGLADAGLLVDPAEARSTPLFFENFAELDIHRRMLSDTPRVEGYRAAIEAVVKPEHTVLDAGTGSGVLATLAALAGARQVFAVDGAEILEVAKVVFERSGVGDVVQPIKGDFGQVQLPEKVDVIVTETFGALALAEGAVDDLAACVERNLADGGRVIPFRIDFYVAPVGSAALRAEALGAFDSVPGVDLSSLAEAAAHRAITLQAKPSDLLAHGVCIAALPFPTGGNGFDGEVLFELPVDGELQGLLAWYDLQLAPGVVLGTGPDAPPTHWGQCFLPLPVRPTAGQPLKVILDVGPAADDRRSLEVSAELLHGDVPLRGSWRVR